eukprot:gb/GFBE01004126.1/.p1 GENE.gb/GFBE01004126.1/~~gb/GFBE01004126.1/.p1  ORF type:complete len:463 (+),score=78.42 gb/GFBE01004126.1/:1-1389(+)
MAAIDVSISPDLDLMDSSSVLGRTVDGLHSQMELDLRRVGATIALERSMQTRMQNLHSCSQAARKEVSGMAGTTSSLASLKAHAHTVSLPALAPLPVLAASGSSQMLDVPSSQQASLQLSASATSLSLTEANKSVQMFDESVHERVEHIIEKQKMCNSVSQSDDPSVQSLKEAFRSIRASFDLDNDGTLSMDEVIHVLNRCQLIDERLSSGKVKDFFRTWTLGCNHILGENMTEETLLDGIGWEEFESMLRWCADMKGVEFNRCAARVIRLSRKLCDGKSSDMRRLKTVFDAFCKVNADYLSPYEFSCMCESINILKRGSFATGDAYQIFYKACQDDRGMDFDGFLTMLGEVGKKLGIGKEVYPLFAASVNKLNVDEDTIRKVKLKIKHAASAASTEGWRQFFQDCDEDNSGRMDWDEFFHTCRSKLGLTERENHLKILFEKLDEDDSGELSIDELIEFIQG